MMQSPTRPEARTQRCACNGVSRQFVKNFIPDSACAKRSKPRGGRLPMKQPRAMAPLNAEPREPENANSISAGELKSAKSTQSQTATSEGVLDLLLQSAELLLILGVAGAQGSMLLAQWQQQQQQQQVHPEIGRHSRSTHKPQVLEGCCNLSQKFLPPLGQTRQISCVLA